MIVLIDGYNLMHAVGYAVSAGGVSWEAARTRFLDWLAATPAAKAQPGRMHVVFDAQKGPHHAPHETTHRGLKVTYAHRATADDRIEELLAGAVRPKDLFVVSNDNRVAESARRAGSASWSTQEFTDWLIAEETPTRTPAQRSAPEKPTTPPDDDETAELLAAFTKPKPR